MEQTLTLLVQIAGTHGTVRLDDFVVPYRPDKASFLVTNNHGFTDMDFAVKTETEERVVRFSCSCQDKIVHQSWRPRTARPLHHCGWLWCVAVTTTEQTAFPALPMSHGKSHTPTFHVATAADMQHAMTSPSCTSSSQGSYC